MRKHLIRIQCDRCGFIQDVLEDELSKWSAGSLRNLTDLRQPPDEDLCPDCATSFKEWREVFRERGG